MATPPIQYEAAPDVQVFLRLIKRGECADELEANINVSKTTLELKKSLSKPLQIEVEYIEIWKDNVQLQDNVSLMDYEIMTDELKKFLSKRLQIEVKYIEIWKENVQLQDNVSLKNYEILSDEVVDIIDNTP